MAVLKKILGSTLMETMVATVLIVVLFLMASLILNSVFASSIKGDTQNVSARISELEYQHQNGLITLPYFETYNDWEISLDIENTGNDELFRFEAIQTKTKMKIKTASSAHAEI